VPADARPGDGPPPAQSEQAQSLDQWLRWIPDDPAGLLRRKFMIEHMRHQSEGQQ
jgi:Ca-activated chloride channel family protein